MKRPTYEPLVSWCSLSVQIPSLTDDVRGFVAGAAEQTLFQHFVAAFSVRKSL